MAILSHFLTFWNPVVRLAMDFFCAAFLVGFRKTSNFGSSIVRRDRLLEHVKMNLSYKYYLLFYLPFWRQGVNMGFFSLNLRHSSSPAWACCSGAHLKIFFWILRSVSIMMLVWCNISDDELTGMLVELHDTGTRVPFLELGIDDYHN